MVVGGVRVRLKKLLPSWSSSWVKLGLHADCCAASERVTTNILCCTKKKKSEFQMSVQGPGLGGSVGGAWGRRGAQGGSSRECAASYSSITAINTSARDSKVILEIRLEKQQGASFNMKMEETEKVRHE